MSQVIGSNPDRLLQKIFDYLNVSGLLIHIKKGPAQ